MKTLLIALFCCCALLCQGQSIIFEQLFLPSVRLNTIYSHDFNFSHKDRLHVGQADLNCIIPIAEKLKVELDWGNIFKLKLDEAAKLKFYQIFWNFRPQMLYLNLDYKNSSHQNPFSQRHNIAFGVETGITGIHMMGKTIKKPSFLFYMVNFGLMEDVQSIQTTPIPTITSFVGMAHLRDLNFVWYYGIIYTFNNGLHIPSPFFGIQAKVNDWLMVNATLPIQVKLGVKVYEKLRIDFEIGLSNFATGLGFQNHQSVLERHVFSNFRLRTGILFNFKLHKQFIFILELGTYPYQQPLFRWQQPTFTSPKLSPSLYGGISLFYTFKKSLLGSTIDNVLSF